MKDSTIIKERVRKLESEGREFIISYQYGKTAEKERGNCIIRACLKEKKGSGEEKESATFIELSYHCGSIGERLFDLIANAQDPVLPVHVPDIVRDEVAASLIVTDSIEHLAD